MTLNQKVLAQSDAMNELRDYIADNLTRNHFNILTEMGVINKETGLFNADPVDLSTIAATGAPGEGKKAVAIKGRVEADFGPGVVDIKFLWNGENVMAVSDVQTKYKNAAGEMVTWTQYIPKFKRSQQDRREAWQAFRGILPGYAMAAGWL